MTCAPGTSAATSRPPEVCAYASNSCSSSSWGPASRCGRTQARLRRLPPGMNPSAAEHLTCQLERKGLSWPREQVDGEQRAPAHRVDVGQGVRGRDPAPVVSVVHNWCEEVGGGENRGVAVEPHRTCVVTGVDPDE